MKKGFTLLEIIIVISITAILSVLGIQGILSYRNYVQFQSAYSDVLTVVKDLQNKASNSVSNPDLGNTAPFAYAIFFTNGNYVQYYCQSVTISAKIVRCFKDNYATSRSTAASNNVSVSTNCGGIGFTKLNVKAIKIDQSATAGTDANYLTTGTCSITIKHNLSNDSKSIVVNLLSNTLTL